MPPDTAGSPGQDRISNSAARRDLRLSVAANSMRLDHGPDHERHEMWAAMAQLLNRLADLAPYWHEPYAAPFVPIIEAGLHVAVAYEEARNKAVNTGRIA